MEGVVATRFGQLVPFERRHRHRSGSRFATALSLRPMNEAFAWYQSASRPGLPAIRTAKIRRLQRLALHRVCLAFSMYMLNR